MSSHSTLQQNILDFLSSNPSKTYYLRKLARILDVDPGNLSREIKQLVKEELVKRSESGNQVYFGISSKTVPIQNKTSLDYESIREKLEEIKPELIKTVQDLIRIPSVSGEHPERDIADHIQALARSYGLRTKEVTKDTFRPNLIIESNPDLKETFLLIGHMDTIGIGDINHWTQYPFSGHIAGGKIIGRGAIDMKAGIACELFTLILLKELEIDLPINIRIVLVSNEEGGSTDTPIFDQGMEYLMKNNYISGKAAIYGYGGSYNVGIGHRGVLRVRIKTEGENVHTGSIKWQRKEKGANAVTGMAEILLALENMQLPDTKHVAFPKHQNVITPGTMILHGGSAVSTVPDECTTVVEIRYLPGLDIQEIYRKMKTIAQEVIQKRSGLQVHFEKFVDIPAIALSPNEPVISSLQNACKDVYDDPIGIRGTGPANESFMLIKKGIPTVVFGPIGSGAHAPNEFVFTHSLTKTIEVYIRTIEYFLNN